MGKLLFQLWMNAIIATFFCLIVKEDLHEKGKEYETEVCESEQPVIDQNVSIVSQLECLDELIINAVKPKPSLWNPILKNGMPSATWNLWEKVCQYQKGTI